MPTKAELLEENMKLLKNTIKGWANRLMFMFKNKDVMISEIMQQISIIIDEMLAFSGD